MVRVLFSRSAIVGIPKLGPENQVMKRPNGNPLTETRRCHIGSEHDFPDDIAAELVSRGIAQVYTPGGLSPQLSAETLPPLAPEGAFQLRSNDEVHGDTAPPAAEVLPPQQQRHPGLRQYVRS